jgi:hypothetical protein
MKWNVSTYSIVYPARDGSDHVGVARKTAVSQVAESQGCTEGDTCDSTGRRYLDASCSYVLSTSAVPSHRYSFKVSLPDKVYTASSVAVHPAKSCLSGHTHLNVDRIHFVTALLTVALRTSLSSFTAKLKRIAHCARFKRVQILQSLVLWSCSLAQALKLGASYSSCLLSRDRKATELHRSHDAETSTQQIFSIAGV